MTGAAVFLKVLITAGLIVAAAVLGIWLLIKGSQGLIWLLTSGGKGIAFLVKHTFRFVHNTFSDSFRAVGALLTAVVLIPLTVLNFLFGRWSAGKHYARALEDEIVSFALGVYRVALGNPLHFVGMGMITDGFERRLPDVVARAPRNSGSSVKDGKFEGYKVTGVLPAGGSGARLFLAKPRANKLQALLAAGHADPGQVVIKAFSLSTGSTLPQIVRESRALESARRLGLVLEHELTEKNFHYVMPYVPGESLDKVITKMHAKNDDRGLSDRQLRVALGYVGDMLYTLDAFHTGGLWHKDIKPSNLIISEGRAHLVDLGLVTPLASAMTLTTHGTEYFRDPEMVRQALRGVKVHEVNGVKFDIYSSGAVLYTLVENSFPAHGSLSRVSARCPEVINWIIRRAMADLEGRYGSAQEMLADIRTVLAARDPFAVRPADLPSVNGRSDWTIPRGVFSNGAKGVATAASVSQEPAKPARSKSSSKRVRPVMHTNTAEKSRRRSTGRTLVAAFVGLLFLVGLASVGVLSTSYSPTAESPVSFAQNPVEWCLQNESEPLASNPELPSDPAIDGETLSSLSEAAYRTAETLHVPSQKLSKAAEKRLDALGRQWSRQLDNHLDQVAEHSKRISERAGEAIGKTGEAIGKARAAMQSSGAILLLHDLAPGTSRELIDALQVDLQRRRFETFGNPSDGIGDERDILYTAGARKAIGVADHKDPEAITRLELFLADNPSLDALIWVSQGKDANTLKYHFVRPFDRESKQLGSFAVSSHD